MSSKGCQSVRASAYVEQVGLSAPQAAELARVSTATIQRAWRSGELQVLDPREHDPRFDAEHVRAWARRKRLIA